MDEHTQGKWESSGVAQPVIRDPIFYYTDVICNGTIRVARSSGVGKEKSLANARLIAAAPDLLAACKRYLWQIELAGIATCLFSGGYVVVVVDKILQYLN